MAISDKLTYLNTTKTLIREGLNNLGAGLTSNDTFRSYVNVLNDLYDYLPKVTGSGTNVTLNDTKKGLMKITLDPSELSQSSTPSPSSPQDIHTISGDNTISVKDGNNANGTDYSVNLGDIEYCKIGSYSDRIFRNIEGDPDYDSERTGTWYIKKNIGGFKIEDISNKFGTTTQWQPNLNSTNGIISLRFGKINFATYNIKEVANGTANWGFCKSLSCGSENLWNKTDQLYKFGMTDGLLIGLHYTDLGLEEWTSGGVAYIAEKLNTVLAGTIFYLPLATPTYTPITGTLAEQLEALWKAQSKDGQTNISQVNNDLPFVINASALQDLSTL